MSVTILNVPGNDASRFFVFENKEPQIPVNTHEKFSNRNEANKVGHLLAANILANSRVGSVAVFRPQKVQNDQSGSWDCIQITLKDPSIWNANVKANNGASINVEKKFQEILELQFFSGKNDIYLSPSAQQKNNDVSVTNKINSYLRDQLLKAATSTDDLNKRKDKGQETSVFDTINIDHGSVRAQSYSNGVLTSTFSGNCGSNCLGGSTLATETGLKAKLSSEYPFVRQFVFIAE